MSGVIWSRFFWSDWQGDPALKLCSLGAQGLWMRMLCVAAQHDPIGFVCLAGRPLEATDLARLAGVAEAEADTLLAELDRNGVFSRDRNGRIYSRRMLREARVSAVARRNGRTGGNPVLKGAANPSNHEGNPARDIPPVKAGLKPQSPDSRARVRGPHSPLTPGDAVAGGRADGPPPTPPPPIAGREVGAIPAGLRAEVVGRMGEDYARAWLDPAGWRADGAANGAANGTQGGAAGGTIVCRLGLAADRLARDLRPLLKDRGVAVEGPHSNAAPAPASTIPSNPETA